MFGLTPFELRYDVAGRVGVRVGGGGVMERHVEAEPTAPWLIGARCGLARGWLLARDGPADLDRAAAWLRADVAQRTAAARERQVLQLAALDGALLERLTHRLRTDVMTLGAIAEGALEGLFEEDAAEVIAELRRTGQEAQRRITGAREVMTVLTGDTTMPESVVTTLRAELEGAGRASAVTCALDEEPWTLIGGAGWAACARILAADDRLGDFTIAPDDGGWRVTAAPHDAARLAEETSSSVATPWSDRALGDLVGAAHLVIAAGGSAEARGGGVELVLPAAAG